MFLCSLLTFAQFSGSGSGTENDPYLIFNPIQLNQLRNFLNQEGVYFKLMSDIDLTEFLEDENPDQGWQPVFFQGILDGNGKTISGLWINRGSNDYIGLFGYTSKATVKNLTVVANTIAGKANVGGISGYSDNSTFDNVSFSGKIQGASIVGGISGLSNNSTFSNVSFSGKIQGASYVGGVIGHSNGNLTMTDITANVEVSASGDYVGGVIGRYMDGYTLTVSRCHVYNSKISGNNYVGGACGEIEVNKYNGSSLSFCYIYANITGNDRVGGICGSSGTESCNTINMNNCGFIGNLIGGTYVGGLIGYNKISRQDNFSLQNSFAIGTIYASGDYSGGLVGLDEGYKCDCNGNGYYDIDDYLYHNDILNCYFSGSISGQNYTAGLVGYKQYGTISNSYSLASVAGVKYVGGLIGFSPHYYNYWNSTFSNQTLMSSVAINTRVTATEGEVARLVGHNEGYTYENKSYNRTIVINQGVANDITDDAINGTGVSATTLKLKATYVAMGWDFTDNWEIQETECYPYFKTQTAPPVITSKVVSGATTITGKCVDGGTVKLEIDGVTQQIVSSNHEFSFTVSPLQAGHEVRVSAKVDGKEQSYYTTETVQYLGSGKENDPYQIYTASDLTGVYRKGYFKLMNDIDLTDYINQFSPTEGWQSIGREGSETVHFDGNGHKIIGLWCNSTRDNTGLFSCFANGTIKNLTVEVAKNKQVKGGANTGILIGKMINGTIENCNVSGKVADGTPVGGLVGLFEGGTISNCQANVIINATLPNSYIGGIVGEFTGGTIEKCGTNGTVTATGETSYVGGLAGETKAGTIDQCFTEGTLTATGSSSYVGGIVGKNVTTLTNSYSTANITSSYNAAGVAAYNYGIVDKCYATGNLFSSNYAAGIIGYNDGEKAVVKNCVAMNNKIDVTYESQQQQQGGGYGQRIIGGIKNGAPAPELNNYALKTMQVSVNNIAQKVYDDVMNGVGKNASDLLQASTYQELGWNFTETWTINENENYPLLKNNTGASVKPGEDPNPDPEPILSDDEKIIVAEVTASKGQPATIGIDLENKTTDLTAYQFDLTLPDGVSLSLNDKGKFLVTKTSRYEDDSQTLNVSKLEGNTYRFVCFSMSNEIITGTSGAILNASLTIGASVNTGSYEATITNIVVTKQDGTQMKLKDSKFNIIVTNVIKGDANGDGEVNVSDIVEIVNYIMGKTSANFVQAASDLNGDGEINVTDIVKVVSIIMDTNSSSARMHRSTMNGNLTLTGKGLVKTAIVQHAEKFTAAQFDIILDDGQKIDDVSLNSNSDHCVTWKMTKEGTCRVIVYSLTNSVFDVNESELMSVSLTGMNGRITVENVMLVTANSNTTDIGKMTADKSAESWHTLDGRKIDKQPSKKGIYIHNGKKFVVR